MLVFISQNQFSPMANCMQHCQEVFFMRAHGFWPTQIKMLTPLKRAQKIVLRDVLEMQNRYIQYFYLILFQFRRYNTRNKYIYCTYKNFLQEMQEWPEVFQSTKMLDHGQLISSLPLGVQDSDGANNTRKCDLCKCTRTQ